MESHSQPANPKIFVERRAWVEDLGSVRARLDDLDAKLEGGEEIKDEHYAAEQDFGYQGHTYEKTGASARVRQSHRGEKTVVTAEIKRALLKEGDLFGHGAFLNEEIWRGDLAGLEKARRAVKEAGFPAIILTLEKERENYRVGDFSVRLDRIENYGSAVEVSTRAKDLDEAGAARRREEDLLLRLGISQTEVLKSGVVHEIIDARMKRDPALKIRFLEDEIARFEKERKKKLAESEYYFRQGGETWHDNAAWDALMENVSLLEIKIRSLKEELISCRRTLFSSRG